MKISRPGGIGRRAPNGGVLGRSASGEPWFAGSNPAVATILLALSVLLLAGCIHRPPVVVPPPITPTPVITPTPESTPALPPGFFIGVWGIGFRAETFTQQGHLWNVELNDRFDGGMLGDLEGRISSEDPESLALSRIPPYARQLSEAGKWVVVGVNWADAVYDGRDFTAAPCIDPLLDTMAATWDRTAWVLLADEAGDTKAMAEARVRFWRAREKAHGLAPKPLAFTFIERHLWELDGHLAAGYQIAMIEAYGAGSGNGRAEDARLITAELDRMLPLIPSDKVVGVWGAEYDRNGAWQSPKEDLASLVMVTARWVRAHVDRAKILMSFCWVRGGGSGGWTGGGARDYRDVMVPQQYRRRTYILTGIDPGPEVPPAETPTPTPTPEPGAPGVIVWDKNSCDVTGASATCTAKRVNVGSQAGPAMATVSVSTVCGDCGGGDAAATLSFPGGRDSKASMSVSVAGGSQLCQRTAALTGSTGAPLEQVGEKAWASWSPSAPGARWFKCAGFYAGSGNKVGTAVNNRSQADAARPWAVAIKALDSTGKVVQRKTVEAVRDDKGAVPGQVALGILVISPPGQLCIEGAEYSDSHTPLAIVGQACVPYGVR